MRTNLQMGLDDIIATSNTNCKEIFIKKEDENKPIASQIFR